MLNVVRATSASVGGWKPSRISSGDLFSAFNPKDFFKSRRLSLSQCRVPGRNLHRQFGIHRLFGASKYQLPKYGDMLARDSPVTPDRYFFRKIGPNCSVPIQRNGIDPYSKLGNFNFGC